MGPRAPESVTCYLEIVPTDTVKYEVAKPSGFLRVDRPQRYSNVCPTPHGFLPQTLCGSRIAKRSGRAADRAPRRRRSDGRVHLH
jgi:inorganic pyrophosphatase